MVAGFADQADIFLLPRIGEGAEHLVLEHVGEADDRVERRAQLVADDAEEAALGDLDLVGAVARFGQCGTQRDDLAVRPSGRAITGSDGIAGVGEFEREVRVGLVLVALDARGARSLTSSFRGAAPSRRSESAQR